MKNLIMLIVLTMLMFSSCKDFVAIDGPKTELITNKVFQNDETANAAMLTVYGQMFANANFNPYTISLYTGLSSDELVNNNSQLIDIYTNNVISTSTSRAHEVWKSVYAIIYAANSVYEGCAESSTLSTPVKNQLMGEALFVRAYCNFYLVNLYGDIPQPLSTDYVESSRLSRTTTPQVYNQIVTDLNSAYDLLNINYVGIDGMTTSPERIRANKSVVTALLARTYLFSNNYPSAEVQATKLIENGSLYALVGLDQVFQKNNKEAIWQIMPTNNPSSNTLEGANYTLTAAPVTQSKSMLSSQLLLAFEQGDLRRTTWVGKYTDITKNPNIDYYFSSKYRNLTGANILEYSVSLRLAEQYLIRAEARNEQNNISGAISDLNEVRKRSRAVASVTIPNPLPALEATLTKDQVKNAILHERQVEFFVEYGNRWFDLKRTNAIDGVMVPTMANKGGTWKNDHQVWPIPNTEILNNPKLTQNKGYN